MRNAITCLMHITFGYWRVSSVGAARNLVSFTGEKLLSDLQYTKSPLQMQKLEVVDYSKQTIGDNRGFA